MSKGRFVVAPHRPWLALLQAGAVVASLAVIAYLAYAYGRATIAMDHAAARAERGRFEQERRQLVDENTALGERVAMLERAVQIDKKAYADVDKHLVSLQDEIFALKEEVAFYRGIVASERGEGLRIQSFTVRPGPNGRDYRFALVLTQDMKSDKVVSGIVNVFVAGEQAGRTRRLSGGEVLAGQGRRIEFQFKYFQKLEGHLTLPEGFAPRSVSVQVIASGEDEAVAEKTFEWPTPEPAPVS